jgi:hypothetical protein
MLRFCVVQLSERTCDAHVRLACALSHLAVVAQPGQPLAMGKLRLGLEQQSSGIDRVLEAPLHGQCAGLMLGPDAGGEIGERVAGGDVGLRLEGEVCSFRGGRLAYGMRRPLAGAVSVLHGVGGSRF